MKLIRDSIELLPLRYTPEDWRKFEQETGLSFPPDMVWMASRAPEFIIETEVDEYPDPDYDPRVDRVIVHLPHPGMSRQELADQSASCWQGFSPAINSQGMVSFVNEDDLHGLWEQRLFPFVAYPGTPGMVSWGESIDGCYYFLVPVEGGTRWRLLISSVAHARWVDMPLLDFLEGLVSQELVCSIMGEGSWSNASLEFIESKSTSG